MKFLTIILVCWISVNLEAALFFTSQMIAKHLEPYTDKEIQLIEKDLTVVRSVCVDQVHINTEKRFYLATAGAPGARKTTILEKFVNDHPEYQNGVYLDPDPRTLKFMVHTYHQSLTALLISRIGNYDQVIKEAYDKWRAGSNYIVLSLFEEVVAAGHSVIYGATSTGAHIPEFFAKLKDKGYQIILLLCSCPDHLRKEAIEYRNQVVRFYQSSPEDALAKGKFFPQRMKDYFDYADVMFFFWSDDLFSSERLAGIWQNEKFEIHDSEAMDRFVEKYEADRASLAVEGKDIPSFESYLAFSKSN